MLNSIKLQMETFVGLKRSFVNWFRKCNDTVTTAEVT